jgi:hypothetical protein
VISGTAVKWYDTLGVLPNSTALQDGATYYATQTENGCENTNKLAITILYQYFTANDYAEMF